VWFVVMPLFALLAGAAAGLAWPARAESARAQAESAIEAATGRPHEAAAPAWTADLPMAERLDPWWRLASARARFVARFGWGAALLAIAVAAAALSGRPAIAAGDRVPSPALAHLCKRGAGLGLAAAALFTGLPVALPLPLAPLAVLASILLFGGYLANLPDRV
jgi:hypothetical protein